MKPLTIHRASVAASRCAIALLLVACPGLCKDVHIVKFTDDLSNPEAGSLRYALNVQAEPGDVLVFDQPATVVLKGSLDIPQRLQGLTVKGPGAIRGTDLFHLYVYADGVTIDNVTQDNCAIIVREKVRDARITGSLFIGRFAGIELDKDANNAFIGGNTFQFGTQTAISLYQPLGTRIVGNAFSQSGWAIAAHNDPDVRIQNNTMQEGSLIFLDRCYGAVQNNSLNLDAAINGIWAINCQGNTGKSLSIDGNTLTTLASIPNVFSSGIDIEGSGVSITNNTITGAGVTGQGIGVGYGADGYSSEGMVNIAQNTIKGFNTGVHFSVGNDKTPQATITGNHISNCRTNGFWIDYEALSGSAVFSANDISFIGSAKEPGIGIRVENANDGLAFNGNLLTNIFGTGTSFDAILGNIQFQQNYIAYCQAFPGNAVRIGANSGGGTLEAQKNTIEFNQGNAYWVQGSRLSVKEDHIRHNAGAGVKNAAQALVSMCSMECNAAGGIDNSGCACGAQQPANLCYDPQTRAVTGQSAPGCTIEFFLQDRCTTGGNPDDHQGAAYIGNCIADGNGNFSFTEPNIENDIRTGMVCTASKKELPDQWTTDYKKVTCLGATPTEPDVVMPSELTFTGQPRGLREYRPVQGGASIFSEHCLYLYERTTYDFYKRAYCAPVGRKIVRAACVYCPSLISLEWRYEGMILLLDDGEVIFLEYRPLGREYAPPVARGNINRNSSYDPFLNLDGDALYCITQSNTTVSRDSGRTWQDDVTGIPAGSANYGVAVDSSQMAYLAHGTGLYRQYPDSAVWRKVTAWPKPSCTAVHVDRANRLYAASFANVYYSTDNGGSWIAHNSGLQAQNISGFSGDAFGNMYAWNANRVYRSLGGTQPWTRIDQPITGRSFEQSSFLPIINDLIADSGLVCATSFGVFASTDFGATWTEHNDGVRAEVNYGYFIRPDGSELVSTHLGIFRRASANGVWSKTFPVSGYMASCPIFSDGAGNMYTVAERLDPAVYNSVRRNWKSTDGGLTWSDDAAGIASLATGQSQQYFVDESGVQHYAAYDFPQKINRKVPGGNWEADISGYTPNANDQPLAFGSDRRGAIYLSLKNAVTGAGTLLKRGTAGGTWTPDTAGLNGAAVYVFTVDKNGAMWAGTFGSGLYKRVGSAWIAIPTPSGLNANAIFSLTADDNGATIAAFSSVDNSSYVGHGVFMTTDDGQSWRSLGTDTVIVRQLCTFGTESYARTDYGIVHLAKNSSGGTPKYPVLTLSTKKLTFGSVQIGQSQTKTFQIGNQGNDTLHVASIETGSSAFSRSGTVGDVPPGGSVTASLLFAPDAWGAVTGRLLLVSDASTNPDTVLLEGVGVGRPRGSLMTKSLRIQTTANRSIDTAFAVGNIGSDTLRISSILSTDPRISVNAPPLPIAPYAIIVVGLHFTGAAEGVYTARCILTENGSPAKDTVTIEMLVTGTRKVELSTTAMDFGDVRVRASKVLSLLLRNVSPDTVRISRMSVSNPGFTVSPSNALLVAADSVDMQIRFEPLSAGQFTAIVTMFDDALQPVDSLPVTGRGVVGALFSADSRIVDFGPVTIGQSKSALLTLSNPGDDTLRVASAASTQPEFGSARQFFALAPSELFADTVRFSPIAVGSRNGLIVFTHNGTPAIDTIRVTGEGVSPTGVEGERDARPGFVLEQIYPNPTEGKMTVRWRLSEGNYVAVRVYDLYGRETATLTEGLFPPGIHELITPAGMLTPGMYLIVCNSGSQAFARRVVVIR